MKINSSNPPTFFFTPNMLQYLKTKGFTVKERVLDNSSETLLAIDHAVYDDIGMLASPLDSEPCEIGIISEDIYYLIQDAAPDVNEQFWQDVDKELFQDRTA